MVRGVRRARGVRVVGRLAGLPRERDGVLGDAELGLGRAPREALDRVAVVVARGAVLAGVDGGGVLAERLLGRRGALDEERPVGLVGLFYGDDGVGDGALPLRLALRREALGVAQRHAPRAEAVLEPRHRGRVAALRLDGGREGEGEGARERRLLAADAGEDVGDAAVVALARLGDALRPHGRGVAVGEGLAHRPGERGHALREHDAEQDRERPQLGERQQLDLLEAADEGGEVLGVGGVVRQARERLGDLVDAREALVRAGGQLRQDAVVGARDGYVGVAELVPHDVVVVEQPAGGGRDGLAGVAGRGPRAVGRGEVGEGVAEDGPQRAPARPAGVGRLGPREAPGVLGEVGRLEEVLGERSGHSRRGEAAVKVAAGAAGGGDRTRRCAAARTVGAPQRLGRDASAGRLHDSARRPARGAARRPLCGSPASASGRDPSSAPARHPSQPPEKPLARRPSASGRTPRMRRHTRPER